MMRREEVLRLFGARRPYAVRDGMAIVDIAGVLIGDIDARR